MMSSVPIVRMNGHLEVPIHTPEAARLSQLLPYKTARSRKSFRINSSTSVDSNQLKTL
jgi:hypothetical protein